MYIRGAPTNGIQKHLVYILYDRRIIYVVSRNRSIIFLFTTLSFHALQISVIQIAHAGVVRLKIPINSFTELRIINQNWVGAQARVEFDFVQRLNIRRVGHRNEKAVASLV